MNGDEQDLRGLEFEGELVRDRLLAALRHEILGPQVEDEVLDQSPKTRYLVGMLAPRGTDLDAMEQDSSEAVAAGEDGSEDQVRYHLSLEASAIGLSTVVDGSATSLTVTAEWGAYRAVDLPPEELNVDDEAEPDAGDPAAKTAHEDTDETEQTRKKKRYRGPKKRWHRLPQKFTVDIALPDNRVEGSEMQDGVEIRWLVTPYGSDRILSIFMDNLREVLPGKRPHDSDYLYQPRLTLEGAGNPFLPRKAPDAEVNPDPDLASADLIYRNRLEFAVGHGVAAGWDQAEGEARASRVFTEVVPSHEVPRVTPREDERLSMDYLAEASRDEIQHRLGEFVADYSSWLDDRESEIDSIPSPMNTVAVDHVGIARESVRRMRAGIESLSDDDVLDAFRFANRAMALQRRRSVMSQARRREEAPPSEADIPANWRPFQIGFILQVLPGLADPMHTDRGTADLLWFPTGGGKTEAYLGLTAFIAAYRRLRDPGEYEPEAGVAVIMRYTLRLLTIQQFQRALVMISACEYLRTLDPEKWGKERFTIGLWVGNSVTPGNYKDAVTALNRLKKGQDVYEKSPYQVLSCPWCGSELKPDNYVADDDTEGVYIKCWDPDCIFSARKSEQGIPAVLIDSQIYHHPPTLLLATVDKFAQMPWKGEIQSLFGHVDRYCPRHGWLSATEDHAKSHPARGFYDLVTVQRAKNRLAPPDLIIQDELHLISGPLGSLVGLYEPAIDALCTSRVDTWTSRPKVIASTATVRRAKDQVLRLFDRDVALFPPLGLDASDSFFATETDEDPGRLYVGIFGPGRSIKTTLVRTYAALLGRALYEFERSPGEKTDAYMTLVGYFNSLRELGGAVRLVEDDVPSRLRALRRRGFSPNRIVYESKELTSRRSSSQISDTLDALDRTFPRREKGQYPIDVLLASNMISVGVDIDRLGLMVVSGQPKTTAEYIQATSRVGRAHPGLVVQIYNWTRPRDISHYESFHHYHETFYRHVEATSVTPFSERARDRALPAVLVSYARLAHPDWSNNKWAKYFRPDDPLVQGFERFLVERARRVSRHGDDVAEETRRQLEDLVSVWEGLTHDSEGLVYSARGLTKAKMDERMAILLRPMELEATQGQWPASGSLREVEEETDVVLVSYSEEEGR